MDAFLTALEHHVGASLLLAAFFLMLVRELSDVHLTVKLPSDLSRIQRAFHKIETGEDR